MTDNLTVTLSEGALTITERRNDLVTATLEAVESTATFTMERHDSGLLLRDTSGSQLMCADVTMQGDDSGLGWELGTDSPELLYCLYVLIDQLWVAAAPSEIALTFEAPLHYDFDRAHTVSSVTLVRRLDGLIDVTKNKALWGILYKPFDYKRDRQVTLTGVVQPNDRTEADREAIRQTLGLEGTSKIGGPLYLAAKREPQHGNPGSSPKITVTPQDPEAEDTVAYVDKHTIGKLMVSAPTEGGLIAHFPKHGQKGEILPTLRGIERAMDALPAGAGRVFPSMRLTPKAIDMRMARLGAKTYIGTKILHAVPMTRGEYNLLRGWQIPADENPADQGYLVQYTDNQTPNVDGFSGYVSWAPKDVFERSYHPYMDTTPQSMSVDKGDDKTTHHTTCAGKTAMHVTLSTSDEEVRSRIVCFLSACQDASYLYGAESLTIAEFMVKLFNCLLDHPYTADVVITVGENFHSPQVIKLKAPPEGRTSPLLVIDGKEFVPFS